MQWQLLSAEDSLAVFTRIGTASIHFISTETLSFSDARAQDVQIGEFKDTVTSHSGELPQ